MAEMKKIFNSMVLGKIRCLSVTNIMVVMLVLCFVICSNSCSNENIAFNKGEQYFAMGEYYQAASYYKKSYSRTSAKDKGKRAIRAFKMGECYRRINYTQKAISAYQNAVRYGVQDSSALFHLACVQLKAGQYKQAGENFRLYLSKDANNELASAGLLSCELAPQWKESPINCKIKKEQIFNSRRSDYSPVLSGDEYDVLYVTSTRNQAK